MATWSATESWQREKNPQDASYLISPEIWKWGRKRVQRKAVSEGERKDKREKPFPQEWGTKSPLNAMRSDRMESQ